MLRNIKPKKAIIICVIIGSLVPFCSQTAPQITIEVRDEQGNPFHKALVHEFLYHPPIDKDSQTLQLCTDSNGRVVLPERIVWSSIAGRFLGSIREFWTAGMGAEFWPSVSVDISAEGYRPDGPVNKQGGINLPQGQPLEYKFVLVKLKPGEEAKGQTWHEFCDMPNVNLRDPFENRE